MIPRLTGFIVSLLICFGVYAAEAESRIEDGADSLRVSLVTCDAGPEIFELYGHQAVRVSGKMKGHPVDVVYNYGMFDFDSPGFIYRFVKGATDYYAAAMPTDMFLYSYERRGSKVTEYPVALSPDETERLIAMLNHDITPEHRTYRYKYFSNNCSTRILDNVDAATRCRVVYPANDVPALTYRDMLRNYNAGYPWYQLGIDLALGSALDREVSPRERMFAPLALAQSVEGAHRPAGRPLTTAPVTLVEGRGDMRLTPTPWYLSPLFIFWEIAVIAIGAAVYCRLRRRRCPLLISLWGVAAGLAGCLLWFLVFISEHEGTSPNLLAVWLNPFWLIAPCLAWSTRLRKALRVLLTLEGIAAIAGTLCLLLSHQYINPALLPLILATVVICAMQIFPAQRHKKQVRRSLA